MLYPEVTESRSVWDLNGIWEFKLDDGTGIPSKWYRSKLEDSVPMPVPASYNDIYEGREYREHMGYVFYQKEIMITKEMLRDRLVLRLGSATHKAEIYINSHLATKHRGGFLPFEVEINDYSQVGKNYITIAVDNTIDDSTLPVGHLYEKEYPGLGKVKFNDANFDFFNYAGLMRPIKLYTTPKNYIEDITLRTSIDGTVVYNIDCVGKGEVTIFVFDEDGNRVARAEGRSGKFIIESPHLWQPLNAYLYKMRVCFSSDKMDLYEMAFGIREVKVEGNQFFINEKPFYFKGFGKHEDSPINGRGYNEVVNIKDMNLLKWIGANSIRTSHYPYSDEMMRLCDQQGIVVIDEVAAVGLNYNFMATNHNMEQGKAINTWDLIKTYPQHKQDITELINRDKNYACVVMWSVANEPASAEKGAYEYFKPLVELAKKLDVQKRPVTIVTQEASNPKECKIAELVDIIAINRYYGWYNSCGNLKLARSVLMDEFEGWEKRCPNKPIMVCEYGADAIAGFHDTTPTMFSEEYQMDFLKEYHKIFDKVPNLIGEHVWNFADFNTEASTMRVQGNKKGIFTRDRKPKMAAHYLKRRWEGREKLN
ncbi:MAG TPA: beta-glucuronidase [Candidatus Merdenecus merdavium]|nr:beta-glucuronidase [Candidatus Merdenecus merdavium]